MITSSRQLKDKISIVIVENEKKYMKNKQKKDRILYQGIK